MVAGDTMQRGRPDYLFIGLVSVSLLVHVFVFLHIAGIYSSKAMTYIELTLQNVSKPYVRAIPRPRLRYTAPRPNDVKIQPIRHHVMPRISIDPADALGKSPLSEVIDAPTAKDISSYQASAGEGEFLTRMDYFEMLRLRIESRKKYPEAARNRHIEGRVKVRFALNADGTAEMVEIVKSSGHSTLDQAAVHAVRTAAPFPMPPSRLFQAPLNMEIIIVFELT